MTREYGLSKYGIYDAYDLIPWIGGALLIVAIPFAVRAIIQEQRAWERFVVEHHCTVTGKTAAQTLSGISSKGDFVSSTIPSTTTYRCDDGLSYTR